MLEEAFRLTNVRTKKDLMHLVLKSSLKARKNMICWIEGADFLLFRQLLDFNAV
ncbi:hypothetical protein [Picosynechococcus sp. NKBG15041c]|uniref:hypothetical protein n=1 Tax=Picosynechococcus sp. NKBG15041c TaxID=1407650 RepID=UPI00191BF7EB